MESLPLVKLIKKSDKLIAQLKKYGANEETITSILGNFSVIRGKWGDLFTKLGKTATGKDLDEFKKRLVW